MFDISACVDIMEDVSVRSRRRTSEAPCCPVCGCTLRHGEFRQHLATELERLARLSAKHKACPGTSANEAMSEPADPSSTPAADVYERVRKNRERRLRACRSRETVACPVCGRRVPLHDADAHADACLSLRTSDDEGTLDVDVEGDSFGLEYEWCSEVRVRASALHMHDGGEPPHGAVRLRRASTDAHLVVDADEDRVLYGPPQYRPEHIAEPSASPPPPSPPSPSSAPPDPAGSQLVVIDTLKARIRELEQQVDSHCHKAAAAKCLICIGPYDEPVVSIQCWHVHCEGCWLASLRAKKTCPQCNAITTSQHLRRIYL